MTIDIYKHPGAKRSMIPTAEQQAWADEEKIGPRVVRYPRNKDLDPQLMWRGKDEEDLSSLTVNAPPIYIQEQIHPKAIIERLEAESRARKREGEEPDLFGDFNGRPADQKARTEFYEHDQNWTNRLVLGDSLLVMASFAEREALRGQVQCIYFDPPFGIQFNSNFQPRTDSRKVTDGKREDRSREPEVIQAFRDTWRDGVNSYLSYLRDRLLVARDLLSDTGSIFLQMGEDNAHLVRGLMDEVFGRQNFVVQISIQKTGSQTGDFIQSNVDYILWFAKDKAQAKFRRLFLMRSKSALRQADLTTIDRGDFSPYPLTSDGFRETTTVPFEFEGATFHPGALRHWGVTTDELARVGRAGRLVRQKAQIRMRYFHDDYPVQSLGSYWSDVGGATGKVYVVQTAPKVVERCILMATDPGDLVLDPTCGSGTIPYVAEQWGRRWIAIDTSRVALTLARARMMGASYPFYLLQDSEEGLEKENELLPPGKKRLPPTRYNRDIRRGFVYERVPHVTLKGIGANKQIDVIHESYAALIAAQLGELASLTGVSEWTEWSVPRQPRDDWNGEASRVLAEHWGTRRARQLALDESVAKNAELELLFDRPYVDRKRTRVAGPFTFESLSPHRVIPVGEDDPYLAETLEPDRQNVVRFRSQEQTDFGKVVVEHLRRAGVRNTKKDEHITFESLAPRPGDGWVSYEGRYEDKKGKVQRVAVAVGPEYDAVGRDFMVQAQKEALRGLFDVLVVCGFQFAPETDESRFDTRDLIVLKARMNQDIRVGDRLKNTGASNMFVVFGEPDIEVRPVAGQKYEVEILGVDIFDPTTGELRSSADPRDDVACWFIDDAYDDESFFVRHAYFLNGKESDPYAALKRALGSEVDKEAWESLYTATSRPFARPDTGKICVKVINHFGDEVQKVFRVR
ncbi:site-specific DNA-methyltransferase [Sphingomonas aerophila]|uniref:site-specific DNA-methyltransferase (adenine-specific) n=1 Tax=Sphingomonas aerophila TaxID=1344948 RepID=A0A7W9EVT9_9SPHN|nr:site-specific DNA-methyltransferase [Sphingomonas aerophila]MBB5716600.1 adenine-specific DNA-methyltransferase [Sphingomonas aerophila]